MQATPASASVSMLKRCFLATPVRGARSLTCHPMPRVVAGQSSGSRRFRLAERGRVGIPSGCLATAVRAVMVETGSSESRACEARARFVMA